jgi:hypothetical protein
MKTKRIAIVVLAVAAAVAAGKASWKWHGKVGQAYAPHMIAGWSWGGHVNPHGGGPPPPQD